MALSNCPTNDCEIRLVPGFFEIPITVVLVTVLIFMLDIMPALVFNSFQKNLHHFPFNNSIYSSCSFIFNSYPISTRFLLITNK